MKCPKCVELNLKSKVYVSSYSTSTLRGWTPYYDEDGKLHSHDPNGHCQEWSCSNQHRGCIRTKAGCDACNKPPTENIDVYN